jgi:hypothetical protein
VIESLERCSKLRLQNGDVVFFVEQRHDHGNYGLVHMCGGVAGE